MTTQTAAPARRTSAAKARLLEVADELFYAEGVNQTGIDRIIAVAGVTKATFYKQYGSKDRLILDYIDGRDRQVRESLEALAAEQADPVVVLGAVIDAVVADTGRRGFRGDPFVNAAAEFASPAHPVRMAIAAHRDWFTGFVEDLFRSAGAARPGVAADSFTLLRDGALVGAYAGDAIGATSAFVRAATQLIPRRPHLDHDI